MAESADKDLAAIWQAKRSIMVAQRQPPVLAAKSIVRFTMILKVGNKTQNGPHIHPSIQTNGTTITEHQHMTCLWKVPEIQTKIQGWFEGNTRF